MHTTEEIRRARHLQETSPYAPLSAQERSYLENSEKNLPVETPEPESAQKNTKSCSSNYRQLAFALPFLAVTIIYSGNDFSPASCQLALVAGTLAGALSYGVYRAIKWRHKSPHC